MIFNIINEEINTFYNKRKHNLRLSEHLRLEQIFNSDINENEMDINEKENVLNLIKNNQWEKPNSQRFFESLKNSKHSMMLTDYSTTELSKMKLFKLNDYNIGFALKQFENKGYSEIVAVHNNEPDIKNIGHELIQAVISNGGCYLDHFDGFLSDLYGNMGFKEYKREPYNPKYDPKGEFKSRYGEKDVIYRKHIGC
ncbi:MAG: hypothetical protein PF487_01125 [Bacteroidales bacterium]|jgi:hypothetical protein|nr:hypothetical protein [Bacteroidales bacterium]